MIYTQFFQSKPSVENILLTFFFQDSGEQLILMLNTHKNDRVVEQHNKKEIIYLVYNFFNIMSDQDSIDGLYLDRYDVNYFNPSHLEVDKGSNLKQTGLIEQVFGELNMSYSQKYEDEEVIQNHGNRTKNLMIEPRVSSFPRAKKIICVGQKFRTGYMRTKKGHNEQTNDLSINVCTLIKSFCDEYQVFEHMQQGDAELINQFKKGKSNVEALRKLMSTSSKFSEIQINQFENSKELTNNSLRQYFKIKLQDPEVLRDLLKSKKMKFTNKIILIKYLESIRKSTQFPEEFKGWKTNKC